MSLASRLAIAALLLAPLTASAAPPVAEKPRAIDLVVCLDVSGSMNGLIDSAKIKLWDIVNELARVKPTPNLRVALYSYGNPAYGQASGYVRKEIDLTTDLDEVYAKLNALRISGGEEYVARVTQTGLKEQKWADEVGALKVVFVCGNEPADQDKQVPLAEVAEMARKQGVIVNTIHCGPDDAGWREFAVKCGGSYTTIDQDRAKRDLTTAIKSPFDTELVKLGEKLNTTYVAFGAAGERGAANQLAQDRAAGAAAPAAEVARAVTKANALYKNSAWDLIDCLKDNPKLDVTKMKPEELPEEMRKLKPEERVAFLKKKGEERAAIQKEINELSAKRAKFVEEERKKLPKTDSEKALDEALKGIIREQAKAKGFEVPAAEKK
ncbi:MAG TPA: vWA domain-containing protein [Fimbriiglobus sp.]|jgi:hypothetical protein|nr:vWA domain-containing protein [Fimbriiglobus sp.]